MVIKMIMAIKTILMENSVPFVMKDIVMEILINNNLMNLMKHIVFDTIAKRVIIN